MTKWARRTLLVLGILVLIPVHLVATTALWLWAAGSGTPTARGSRSDAIWLGHAWVDGRKTQSDVDELAWRIRRAGIRDLFVHSGPLRADGSLDPALRPQSKWLIKALQPTGVRVQAWLGTVVTVEPGDGMLDPEDAAARERVVTSARQVLDDGFAGVHFDLEPLMSGTPGYLKLLDATRELTRGRQAVLSVAAHQVEFVPGVRIPGSLLIGKSHWWSENYFRDVAARVDQVAIMSYDTGVPFEAGYSGYVRVQTRMALKIMPPGVTLYLGIPAYHSAGIAHTDAETVAAALKGVRLALDDGKPDRPVGVAIYVDFEATDQDWATYYADWVG